MFLSGLILFCIFSSKICLLIWNRQSKRNLIRLNNIILNLRYHPVCVRPSNTMCLHVENYYTYSHDLIGFLQNHSLQSCFGVVRRHPAGQMKSKLKAAAVGTHWGTEAYFVPVLAGHVNRSCADVLWYWMKVIPNDQTILNDSWNERVISNVSDVI